MQNRKSPKQGDWECRKAATSLQEEKKAREEKELSAKEVVGAGVQEEAQ